MMSKVADIAIAFVGQGGGVVFERLAWWLTREGAAEATRLENDPLWERMLILGFDAGGSPLVLTPDAAAVIGDTIGAAASDPLGPTEAEEVVAAVVDAGLAGRPMPAATRWQQARVNLLRVMYADRCKASSVHQRQAR